MLLLDSCLIRCYCQRITDGYKIRIEKERTRLSVVPYKGIRKWSTIFEQWLSI